MVVQASLDAYSKQVEDEQQSLLMWLLNGKGNDDTKGSKESRLLCHDGVLGETEDTADRHNGFSLIASTDAQCYSVPFQTLTMTARDALTIDRAQSHRCGPACAALTPLKDSLAHSLHPCGCFEQACSIVRNKAAYLLRPAMTGDTKSVCPLHGADGKRRRLGGRPRHGDIRARAEQPAAGKSSWQCLDGALQRNWMHHCAKWLACAETLSCRWSPTAREGA